MYSSVSVVCSAVSHNHLQTLSLHWTVTLSSYVVHNACLSNGEARCASRLLLLYNAADDGGTRYITVLIVVIIFYQHTMYTY